MRRLLTTTMTALFLLTCTPLLAGESIENPGIDEEEKNFWVAYLDAEFERIMAMDLYGVTSQLPTGYMSFKWDWGTIRARNRYNDQRRLGPVMEPIAFTDNNGNEIVNIDVGLNGYGGGHTFQFSYGITDPLDWYIEVPFTYMNVSFDPKVQDIKNADGTPYKDADGDTYKVHPSYAPMLGIDDPKGYDACDFMYETLPGLGRPPLANEFKGKWLLGDINTGFSWNIYRTPRFSVALTPRVFLPTGHSPDPETNLLWGTGPEIETSVGGWAVGFTQGYDLRIFKYKWFVDVIASTEFAASYAFPQQRDYPTNFPVPNPGAQNLDPVAFPDLSHLSGTFTYTPGFSADVITQIQLNLFGVGLGAAYGVQYMQEPELIGDRAFIQMARGLELLGQQTMEAVQLAASISLLPLYIPLDIAFQWRKVLDGYNAIVMDDYYQITLKGYFPLKMLWGE